ncbi:MAG: YqcI/YcgG family protein [Phycisphaerales bacterium]
MTSYANPDFQPKPFAAENLFETSLETSGLKPRFTWLVPGPQRLYSPDAENPSPKALLAAAAFRGLVQSPHFVCIAAQAAFKKGTFRIAHVDAEVGTWDSSIMLGYAMTRFIGDLATLPTPFRPLVVIFEGPTAASPEQFRDRFWSTLQQASDIDALCFSPTREVDSKLTSPHFGYSIGQRGWFVNGSFPSAPLIGRRTPLPTLICNLQSNFEQLKHSGQFVRIQKANTARQLAVQGCVNPYLTELGGDADQSVQFVSVPHGPGGCPFRRISGSVGNRLGKMCRKVFRSGGKSEG